MHSHYLPPSHAPSLPPSLPCTLTTSLPPMHPHYLPPSHAPSLPPSLPCTLTTSLPPMHPHYLPPSHAVGITGPYPQLAKRRPPGTLAGVHVLLSLVIHVVMAVSFQVAGIVYLQSRLWYVLFNVYVVCPWHHLVCPPPNTYWMSDG